MQIHYKYKSTANTNTVQLTTQLWPAVPNPMIQCAHNIGLENTEHTDLQILLLQIHKYCIYNFTNTAQIHIVKHTDISFTVYHQEIQLQFYPIQLTHR